MYRNPPATSGNHSPKLFTFPSSPYAPRTIPSPSIHRHPPPPRLSLRPSTPTAPLPLPPSIDTHQALGSPSGRAGAKRLRGLTAPIPPTAPQQIHRTLGSPSGRAGAKRLRGLTAPIPPTNHPTDPPHRSLIRNCIPHPTFCTTPLPLPSGGTSPHGARQGLSANFQHPDKTKFHAPTEGLAEAKAPLCKGSCQRS